MSADPTLSFDAEVAVVLAVITHPAGFDLDVAGDLLIRTTDQETIEVEWCHRIRSFPSAMAKEAAAFFVLKRHELGLGIDFEAFRAAESAR